MQTGAERGFWAWHATFPPPLESAFQLEMDRMRETRVMKTGLVAVLLYSAFAISDRSMVPDVYREAWAIRFLLAVPMMLLCTFGLYKLTSLRAREFLLAASIFVSGTSLSWIAALSTHPNAMHYQTGITLVVLFGNIVLNLRFRSALAVSVALTAVYGLALSHVASMSLEVRFNDWLFCVSAVAISLIANFRMDQDQRRAYLARIREEARNEELRDAVEKLARMSAEDALTSVANRREFDRRLDIEWGRARRDGQPLALIMIDIDCFKNYNDHYGHPAGDACLQKIAAALSAIPKRSADLVARLGGEEFAVLLPATPIGDALQLAARMRQTLVELQIPHAASRVAPGVTASFGVAAGTVAQLAQPGALLAAADAALYKSKADGRNRVTAHAGFPVEQALPQG